MKVYRRIAAVVASTCLVLCGAQVAVAAPGAGGAGSPRVAGPPAVISLGDSFISGEAGRWRGNANTALPGTRYGTDLAAYACNTDETWCWHDPARIYGASYSNGCNRSACAEITDLAVVRVGGELYDIAQGNRVNIACSGATAEAIYRDSFKGEPRQNDQLARYARSTNLKLVVLSIGGNDIGFGDMITACVKAFTTGAAPCNTSLGPGLGARIAGMTTAARKAVTAIRDTMADAGYDDADYRLVLQSYPAPLPRGADNRYPDDDMSRWSSGGCPFYDGDSDWAHDTMVPAIADAHRDLADAEGIDFLALRHALDGHEVCATGAEQAGPSNTLLHALPEERGEWVRWIGVPRLGQGQTQEFLHPNAYGQQMLGSCLSAIAVADDREVVCANEG